MFNCVICNKSYKRIDVLRTHYASITHRNKVLANIPVIFNRTKLSAINNIETGLNQPCLDIVDSGLLSQSEPVSDMNGTRNDTRNETTIADTEINTNVDTKPAEDTNKPVDNTSVQPAKTIYTCAACNKDYTKKTNLCRHLKKCNIFIEAKTLSESTCIDLDKSILLIKTRNLDKIIPKSNKYSQENDNQLIATMDTTNPSGKHKGKRIVNNTKNIQNNNNNTTNNITINNNILIGDWKTINYVRPTNFENLSVLDDDKNKLLLLASGYHAFKKLLDIIYAEPENKNIHIINRKKDYVKILTVDGKVKVVSAATAYDLLIDKLIDIIDAFIDASEPLIKANPKYKAGIDALRKSHNWDGEGNSRYPEYRKYIELIVENIGRESAINLIRFENDIRQILLNGGPINFNTQSLHEAELLMEKILSEGAHLIKPELLLNEPTQVETKHVEPIVF